MRIERETVHGPSCSAQSFATSTTASAARKCTRVQVDGPGLASLQPMASTRPRASLLRSLVHKVSSGAPSAFPVDKITDRPLQLRRLTSPDLTSRPSALPAHRLGAPPVLAAPRGRRQSCGSAFTRAAPSARILFPGVLPSPILPLPEGLYYTAPSPGTRSQHPSPSLSLPFLLSRTRSQDVVFTHASACRPASAQPHVVPRTWLLCKHTAGMGLHDRASERGNTTHLKTTITVTAICFIIRKSKGCQTRC